MRNPEYPLAPRTGPNRIERQNQIRASIGQSIVSKVDSLGKSSIPMLVRQEKGEMQKQPEYYKAFGKHTTAAYYAYDLEHAVMSDEDQIQRIVIDDYTFIDAVIGEAMTESIDVQMVAELITEGSEEVKETFLSQFELVPGELGYWTKRMMQRKYDEVSIDDHPYTAYLATNLDGVYCEYHYEHGQNRPIRSLLFYPFQENVDSTE